ncbi:coiled-coil domain-containing protein 144A-like isoform X3 [Choloepus didactylus]|uniref:coiled-coil domain-containing protein 144A-like isoform X3 n=1 Tax=Choloepus didactylus TaxID=27675 RepID=UPI00189E0FA5|nr:coiled-coil domain-containing protein 144A-like isoform X3 [Choloepus didactylus]
MNNENMAFVVGVHKNDRSDMMSALGLGEDEDRESPWDSESISESVPEKSFAYLSEVTDQRGKNILNGQIEDVSGEVDLKRTSEEEQERLDGGENNQPQVEGERKKPERSDMEVSENVYADSAEINDSGLIQQRMSEQPGSHQFPLKDNDSNRLSNRHVIDDSWPASDDEDLDFDTKSISDRDPEKSFASLCNATHEKEKNILNGQMQDVSGEVDLKRTSEEEQERLDGGENNQPQDKVIVETCNPTENTSENQTEPINLPLFHLQKMSQGPEMNEQCDRKDISVYSRPPFLQKYEEILIKQGKLELKNNLKLITNELTQKFAEISEKCKITAHPEEEPLLDNSEGANLKELSSNLTKKIPDGEENDASGVCVPVVLQAVPEQGEPSLENVFPSRLYSGSQEYTCQSSSKLDLNHKLDHENDYEPDTECIFHKNKEGFYNDAENKTMRNPDALKVEMKEDRGFDVQKTKNPKQNTMDWKLDVGRPWQSSDPQSLVDLFPTRCSEMRNIIQTKKPTLFAVTDTHEKTKPKPDLFQKPLHDNCSADNCKALEAEFENAHSSPPYSDRTSKVYLNEVLQQDMQRLKNEPGIVQLEFQALDKENLELQKEVEEERKNPKGSDVEVPENLCTTSAEVIEGGLSQQRMSEQRDSQQFALKDNDSNRLSNKHVIDDSWPASDDEDLDFDTKSISDRDPEKSFASLCNATHEKEKNILNGQMQGEVDLKRTSEEEQERLDGGENNQPQDKVIVETCNPTENTSENQTEPINLPLLHLQEMSQDPEMNEQCDRKDISVYSGPPFLQKCEEILIKQGKLEVKNNLKLITNELTQKFAVISEKCKITAHPEEEPLLDNSEGANLKELSSNLTKKIPDGEENDASGVSVPVVLQAVPEQGEPSLENVFPSRLYSGSQEYTCQSSSKLDLNHKLDHENDYEPDTECIFHKNKEGFYNDAENKTMRNPDALKVEMKEDRGFDVQKTKNPKQNTMDWKLDVGRPWQSSDPQSLVDLFPTRCSEMRNIIQTKKPTLFAVTDTHEKTKPKAGLFQKPLHDNCRGDNSKARDGLFHLWEEMKVDVSNLKHYTEILSEQLSKSASKFSIVKLELYQTKDALRKKNLVLERVERDLRQAQCQMKEVEHMYESEQGKVSKYIGKLECLEERLSQLQSENILLRQQLDDAHKKAASEEKTVIDIQGQFQDITKNLKTESEKQSLLEERNKELINECNRLKKQIHQYENEKLEREVVVRQLQQELADSLKKQPVSEASLEVKSHYHINLDETQDVKKKLSQIICKLQAAQAHLPKTVPSAERTQQHYAKI